MYPNSLFHRYIKVRTGGNDVFLEIDLGQPSLVAGFQSQGPPSSKYGLEYMRYISLGVDVSTDRQVYEQINESI